MPLPAICSKRAERGAEARVARVADEASVASLQRLDQGVVASFAVTWRKCETRGRSDLSPQVGAQNEGGFALLKWQVPKVQRRYQTLII